MAARIDPQGRAYKGSQLQTQIYVNRRVAELRTALAHALPSLPADARIKWVSPLEVQGFVEYHDGAFLRALGLEAHIPALGEFWPAGGPRWDALATVETNGQRPGVLLAEGKSYPEELFGDGCGATEPARTQIAAAVQRTQGWLGVAEDPGRWLGRLYQTGNRLAHLYWLREVVGVWAWLVHLLFTDDPHGPTSREQWIEAIEAANEELGLSGAVTPHAGHVLLDARGRGELVEGFGQ